MFREYLAGRPYLRATRETQLSQSVLTLRILVMCKAHASFHEMLSRENSSVFNLLASSLPLSLFLSTLTIKSHNKYKVEKIE